MTRNEEKMKKALKSILNYIEKRKPESLGEAEAMLAMMSVIASETLKEI